jgi:integrator complex subunit 6
MIFLFLVDTSPSMNQRGFNGMTLLDCAKSGAEYFINLRLRDPNSRGDRFLLVTCEEGVGSVKVCCVTFHFAPVWTTG